LLALVSSFISLAVSGQVGVDYTLTKPAKFENRVLASEKSNNGKKFKKSRHFIQNTITHYNYWFNANEKLNMVVARAKQQNRDDYTKLLPFYNYTLEVTVAQKKELDSVIYKCTMGILIHDTRNDWIDNLYLLIGKTYYYKKDFDSAYITFQFLNFAFAPKEKDGYDKPIGSNANVDEGGNANIVSTDEKRNMLQKMFSMPPSRNESLIWKIRTYIAKDQFAESASLIEVLAHDPQFPARLHPDLQEVRALWFYKQSIYDSAAFYLEKALPAAANREESARWEYLIAQLYERVNNTFEAKTFYERTVSHTYNPILEVYARLNAIRQNREGGDDFIKLNIAALVKMAHKDRYEPYKDIIYYAAAQMELERHNKPGAEAFLLQSIRSAGINSSSQRNRAFLQLANLCFEEKKYIAAKNYYDSLNIGALGPAAPAGTNGFNGPVGTVTSSTLSDVASLGDLSWLPDRKAGLAIVVAQLHVIARQDSLQRIALLPAAQRDALIKKMVRYLRRQQGLRDEESSDGQGSNVLNKNNTVPDLFQSQSGAAEWYFNNPSLKAKGYTDFHTNWGNRPNVDNWQVSALIRTQAATRPGEKGRPAQLDGGKAAGAPTAIDFKSLLNNLPLTPAKLAKSQDSVEKAFFALGSKGYQDGIADYLYAIDAYDSLLARFPESSLRPETLLNLYYCYKKIGDEANAARILALMQQKYPTSLYTAKAVNPDSVAQAAGALKVNATHQYEKIYTAFIEGQFDEALAEKKKADSLYGSKYWTPQLLYIESVYFIRTRQDPQAKSILSNIILKFPRTPMAEKAATMIDVLNRRRQIEDYLTHLEVTRVPEDSVVITPDKPAAPTQPRKLLVRNDSNMLVKEDTSQLARARIHLPTAAGAKGQNPIAPSVGIGKLKVDTASMNKITMTTGQLALLHQQIDSINAALKKASADSAQTALLRHRSDSIQTAMKQLQSDTAQLAAKIRSLNSVFTFNPVQPHSVLIVMDKVDPVYVSEARNAFNGYNTENYYSQSLTITNASLNDSLKLVVIGNFGDDNAALDYLQKVKALAPRQIVPWLPANKYTFVVISGPNLAQLLNNKDMTAYRKFLSAVYPGKF
jgi:tetratricopeptide (TPR) repeat protein